MHNKNSFLNESCPLHIVELIESKEVESNIFFLPKKSLGKHLELLYEEDNFHLEMNSYCALGTSLFFMKNYLESYVSLLKCTGLLKTLLIGKGFNVFCMADRIEKNVTSDQREEEENIGSHFNTTTRAEFHIRLDQKRFKDISDKWHQLGSVQEILGFQEESVKSKQIASIIETKIDETIVERREQKTSENQRDIKKGEGESEDKKNKNEISVMANEIKNDMEENRKIEEQNGDEKVITEELVINEEENEEKSREFEKEKGKEREKIDTKIQKSNEITEMERSEALNMNLHQETKTDFETIVKINHEKEEESSNFHDVQDVDKEINQFVIPSINQFGESKSQISIEANITTTAASLKNEEASIFMQTLPAEPIVSSTAEIKVNKEIVKNTEIEVMSTSLNEKLKNENSRNENNNESNIDNNNNSGDLIERKKKKKKKTKE